ncbi:pseudouridine synthase [Fusobacterium sp.]|uniref:pseudouridine synthase n=1 Tax=Fusobacterium sp. TaxID=68766 RepID=UPI002612B6D6|nr:pseudouridine synthase [Fusobacterium sp.]
MRINKFLAELGVGSRRAIDKMIEEKKIKVNGVLAESGIKVDKTDNIVINGRPLNFERKKKVYFMLNKPKRVLSTAKDERGRKTVVDLIDTKERIFPIGRLDYDTEGLILLTNDGEVFNKVIHPRTEVYKTYLVEARGNINMSTLNKLKRGIMLDDKITLPAKAKIILADEKHTVLHFAIKEGRNRQVRRMFESVGHNVINLKRIMLGELNLDGLEIGEYRPLTKKEINYLYSL